MQLSLPEMPETLTYSVIAVIGLMILTAIVVAATGRQDPVAALLVLAAAGAVYCFVGRHLLSLVTAKEAAAAAAVLLAICAVADFAAGPWYQGLLFLLGAAALGFVFVLLQQGASLVELRLGGVVAIAASPKLIQLRMLEQLRDAAILSPDEFASKRGLLGL